MGADQILSLWPDLMLGRMEIHVVGAVTEATEAEAEEGNV
jgi:hypothetical protein